MAALGALVPFCTCPAGGGEPQLRLRDAGIDVLESSKLVARKIALLGVLQLEDDGGISPDSSAERGLYLAPSASSVPEVDASALICVLRGVDLAAEPFWGVLLLLLSSHVFVVRHGPITAASFRDLGFLSEFSQLQVLEGSSPEQNAQLLPALAPALTWVALDLKLKDMAGSDSPSAYFAQQLAAPGGADSDAQLLLGMLVPVRDCLIIKSATLETPEGFATPQAFTSPKLVSHATDGGRLRLKPFFGRFLDGSQLLHLSRSLAHAVSSRMPLVLQRLVNNVLTNYWQLLVSSALDKYCDEIHARIGLYEHVPITTDYIVAVTERKLKSQSQEQSQVAVVNAGQGNFSVFDEFGNLKRQVADADGTANSSGSPSANNAPALNTGLFSFLKNRASRAFTKQFTLFPPTPPSRKQRNGNELGQITEDDDDAEGGGDVPGSGEPVPPPKLSPDQVLAKCTAKIQRYSVPMKYSNTPSEPMPMDVTRLDTIHREALARAKELVTPFLVDLRCPSTAIQFPELSCSLNFDRGEKKLLARIAVVRRRFERANDVSSALFCGELLRYLHSVVLRKSEKDNEAQQKKTRTSSSAPLAVTTRSSGDQSEPPLTKLPFELLTYKSNLDAMVSQYNFVARGPLATSILIGFFQGPVRQRLVRLAQHEYERFDRASDDRRERITALEDSLDSTQRQVQHMSKANAEWSRQEAEAIAEIEQAHSQEVESLRATLTKASERVDRALTDQQTLYQSTMHATRKTINTIDKVAEKSRVVMGYLERYEKGHMFSKSWRQYFFVLDHATLTCYRSKSVFEERGSPCETPVVLTGFRVELSRTDNLKIKLLAPEAGRVGMLRFRAPASVGRETWVKRFQDAAQLSAAGR